MKFTSKIIKNENLVSLFLLFLITLITYGFGIGKLGYYYDDWYVLWSGAARGANSLINLFSTDRPYLGYIYFVLYKLFGDNTLIWQIYALFWRFIGGVAFFYILRILWPKYRILTTLMAVLFIVYPGFLALPNATTKQNHLVSFASVLLSIAFMLQSFRSTYKIRKIFFLILSLLFTANYLFLYEYMIGLEVMRFCILGYYLNQEGLSTVRNLFFSICKKWYPYLIVLISFLFWRLFIFVGARKTTDVSSIVFDYRVNPIGMALRFLVESLKDFFEATFFAWFVKPYEFINSAEYSALLGAITFAVIIVGLLIGYIYLVKKYSGSSFDETRENGSELRLKFLVFGIIITYFAIAPVVLANRELELLDVYKGYGLHLIAGVVLVITSIILLATPKFQNYLLLALIGLSVSSQYLNSLEWKSAWADQKELWWQLSWRAPDIKNNTLVMASLPGNFQFRQDYELWAPLNLIYRPGPFLYPAIQSEALNQETINELFVQAVKDRNVRDIWVHLDFTKLLLLSIPTRTSCLHVIDNLVPIYSENESLFVKQAGSYSRIIRIVSSDKPVTLPKAIFGDEPKHDWCFYYEKAALARQFGNWQEIGNLYDDANSKGLVPEDKTELMPFLEGLVNLGQIDTARQLVKTDISTNDYIQHAMCSTVSQAPQYPPEFKYDHEKMIEIICNK